MFSFCREKKKFRKTRTEVSLTHDRNVSTMTVVPFMAGVFRHVDQSCHRQAAYGDGAAMGRADCRINEQPGPPNEKRRRPRVRADKEARSGGDGHDGTWVGASRPGQGPRFDASDCAPHMKGPKNQGAGSVFHDVKKTTGRRRPSLLRRSRPIHGKTGRALGIFTVGGGYSRKLVRRPGEEEPIHNLWKDFISPTSDDFALPVVGKWLRRGAEKTRRRAARSPLGFTDTNCSTGELRRDFARIRDQTY